MNDELQQAGTPMPPPSAPLPEGSSAASTGAPGGRLAALQAAVVTVRSGARWFWWIAGLSAVNTVMSLTHANTQFVVGLGITAVADAVFRQAPVIGLVIDALVVGFFVWVGFQAQRGKRWAFLAGLAAYVPDTLIYLLLQAWMPVAFHALAIFYIVRGFRALGAMAPVPAAA